MSTSSEGLSGDEVEAYLDRLGIAPESINAPGFSALTRLQRAHVTTVPFETLAITGDPYGERTGEEIVLSVPHLYEKIVERERGGYCFELNGLFHALLAALGYEVHRAAARVASALEVPANHQVNVVELERRYLVDVGTGPPMIRQPLPFPGSVDPDQAGVAWRVTESDRPDATYRTDCRGPNELDWTPRYVFDGGARPLHYFDAANNYLQTAPESPFTGDPTVARSMEEGYWKLSGDTLVEATLSGQRERSVSTGRWHDILARRFNLQYRPSA